VFLCRFLCFEADGADGQNGVRRRSGVTWRELTYDDPFMTCVKQGSFKWNPFGVASNLMQIYGYFEGCPLNSELFGLVI